MSIYNTISSNVYTTFRNIPKGRWLDVIRLYQDRKDEVEMLPLPKQIDVLHMYVEALNEAEEYEKLRTAVEPLLYMALSDEIPVDIGRAYYEDALSWKVNASVNQMEYEEGKYILKELVAMNPKHAIYTKKLSSCIFKDKPKYVQRLKAFAVLMFLVAALVVLIEMLVINPFYPKFATVIEWTRSIMFAVALLSVGIAEGWHLLCSKRKAEKWRKQKLSK